MMDGATTTRPAPAHRLRHQPAARLDQHRPRRSRPWRGHRSRRDHAALSGRLGRRSAGRARVRTFSFAEEALVWLEMARVLRPGGTLMIEVPDFEWVCAHVPGRSGRLAGISTLSASRTITPAAAAPGSALGHPADHVLRQSERRRPVPPQRLYRGQAARDRRHSWASRPSKSSRLFNKGGQALRAR